jgi:hypothetical protein
LQARAMRAYATRSDIARREGFTTSVGDMLALNYYRRDPSPLSACSLPGRRDGPCALHSPVHGRANTPSCVCPGAVRRRALSSAVARHLDSTVARHLDSTDSVHHQLTADSRHLDSTDRRIIS